MHACPEPRTWLPFSVHHFSTEDAYPCTMIIGDRGTVTSAKVAGAAAITATVWRRLNRKEERQCFPKVEGGPGGPSSTGEDTRSASRSADRRYESGAEASSR